MNIDIWSPPQKSPFKTFKHILVPSLTIMIDVKEDIDTFVITISSQYFHDIYDPIVHEVQSDNAPTWYQVTVKLLQHASQCGEWKCTLGKKISVSDDIFQHEMLLLYTDEFISSLGL